MSAEPCPRCGKPIPPDAPLGACPRCLMDPDAISRTVDHRPAVKPEGPAVDPSELRRAILELDLVPADELARVEAEQGEGDSSRLIRALVGSGKLTPYQGGALLQGKPRGLLIGRYLVLDKLGVGGMGMVFKALHRPSGRVVALKILPPSFGRQDVAVGRFRREFQVASRLSHPNVVAAIEASEDRGVHYLTMEYIPGCDLDRLVTQGGPMELRLALHCVIQVARGLEAAHAQGIIHRDVKPGNVMIDPAGVVRVLDLGLARVIEATNTFGQSVVGSLTQSNAYMGTVDFVAPEQADNAKGVDGRADIYSLGCTLCFLLTGRPPFNDETVLKRLIAHQERPAPSLRAARPEVPEALEELYERMMAKRPAGRPRSMSEVVLALESCRTSAREAGDASADLKTFARSAMKRAPTRGRRGPDASIFARSQPVGFVFDPGLDLEDLVGDYRPESKREPIAEDKLPPMPPRSRTRPTRRRTSGPPYAATALALAALAAVGYFLNARRRPDDPAPNVTASAHKPPDTAHDAPAPPPKPEPAPSPKPETSPPPPGKGTIVYFDEFDSPSSGWFRDRGNKDYERDYTNGLYRMHTTGQGQWLFTPVPATLPGEFTCELTGRTYTSDPGGEGSLILVLGLEPGKLDYRLRLHAGGHVSGSANFGGYGANYDPDSVASGKGSRNSMVLHVRRGKIEVVVNGERLGEPVDIPEGAVPTSLAVGCSCYYGDLWCEIERFEIRTPDAPAPGGVAKKPPEPPRITADARAFAGKWYKAFPDQISWHEAKARCEALKGRLAVVANEADNRFLVALAKEQGVGDCWLGATDEAQEGRWVWLDGTPMRYRNWSTVGKQPNNGGGVEHYLVLRAKSDGRWTDQPTVSKAHHPGFICQWD